jgi:hypothetical protein
MPHHAHSIDRWDDATGSKFGESPRKSPGRDRGLDIAFQRGNNDSLARNSNPAKSGTMADGRAAEEEAPDGGD